MERAARLLSEQVGTILSQSRIYETAPWACVEAQNDYLNQVILLDTGSNENAENVLALCLEVERQLGRRREGGGLGYQPRTIDIDLLLAADGRMQRSALLSLPHHFMHLRRFVLQPLCEIAPHILHPVLGLSIADLLANCPDKVELAQQEG